MLGTCNSDLLFFFKQKTEDEMRMSDGSSDVCSSDLKARQGRSQGSACEWNEWRSWRLPVGSEIDSFKAGNKDLRSVSASASDRSEERRVGKECVSTRRSRRSPEH